MTWTQVSLARAACCSLLVLTGGLVGDDNGGMSRQRGIGLSFASAASYKSFQKKMPTTSANKQSRRAVTQNSRPGRKPLSSTTHSRHSAAASVGPKARKAKIPIVELNLRNGCDQYRTCTSCTTNATAKGCAWCKNLNECVPERQDEDTCHIVGRKAKGLFSPLKSDHVTHIATADGEIGTGTCGGILNTENGLYHVHPDQFIVMR